MSVYSLALLLFLSMPMSASATRNVLVTKADQGATTQAHAPAKGSEERRAIVNALRTAVKKMSDLDVVFVVRHLKVSGNWAWVEADPQSADGSQHYERMSGLLARKNGSWVFLEGPPEWPICEQDPDCVDSARYFRKLAQRHPGLTPDIFPG